MALSTLKEHRTKIEHFIFIKSVFFQKTVYFIKGVLIKEVGKVFSFIVFIYNSNKFMFRMLECVVYTIIDDFICDK